MERLRRDGVVIAGVSTRAFAESAWRAGFACETVDAFGDLDQKARVRNLSFHRDLRRRYGAYSAASASRRLSGGSAAYIANFENHPGAVRRLAEGRLLLGNPPNVLARARDPFLLAQVVASAGARTPITLRPAETARADPGRRWLRKPMRGGGGSGVRPWRPGEPPASHEIAQEYIDGVPASMVFLADGRRAVLLGLSRQLIGNSEPWAREEGVGRRHGNDGSEAGEGGRPRRCGEGMGDCASDMPEAPAFRYAGSLYPLASPRIESAQLPMPRHGRGTIDPPKRPSAWWQGDSRLTTRDPELAFIQDAMSDSSLEDRAAAIASTVTAAFGLRGVNGLDFVLRDGDLFALELNPRYPASAELIERATGLSIFQAHTEACLGRIPVAGRPRPVTGDAQLRTVWGKAILYAHDDAVAGDTCAWLDDDAVRDLPFPGERIPRGRPVCTVFARGVDHADCYARLVTKTQTVEANLPDP